MDTQYGCSVPSILMHRGHPRRYRSTTGNVRHSRRRRKSLQWPGLRKTVELICSRRSESVDVDHPELTVCVRTNSANLRTCARRPTRILAARSEIFLKAYFHIV